MVTVNYGTFNADVKYWWMYLIVGILMIPLGIWILATPLLSFISFALFFAWMLLFAGLFQLIFAISNVKSLHGWGWYLSAGIIDFVIGGVLVWYPALASAVLPYFVGFWLMFKSLNGIGYSVDLKNMGVKGWGWLLALAIIVLIFSLILVFSINPAVQIMYVDALISYGLIVLGVATIALSIFMKRVKRITK